MRRVLRHGGFIFGFAILFVTIVIAIFAPFIAPHDPIAQNLGVRLLPPSWMQGGRPD